MVSATDDREVESHEEAEDARQRRSPSGRVVYDAVMQEADEELTRSSSALFWSALAAGLSMGFSMIAEGILRHYLPEAGWKPLVTKLGYSAGFLIVILGRQQLFTENTLTPILPLLRRKPNATIGNVLRLWAIVLVSNLVGAALFAIAIGWFPVLEPTVKDAATAIAAEALAPGPMKIALRGIFAGWLIALMVW